MEIPKEWIEENRSRLVRHARRQLRYGFTYKGHWHYSPENRSNISLDAFAEDVVHSACATVLTRAEKPAGAKWLPFMLNQVTEQIQTLATKILRNPIFVSASTVPVGHEDLDDRLRPLDRYFQDKRPDPEGGCLLREEDKSREERLAEALAILAHWRAAFLSMRRDNLKASEAAINSREIRGRIRDARQIASFLEIVRQLHDNPKERFDTVRQRVALQSKHTPSKANAQRWWQMVREQMPIPFERYVSEFAKLEELKEL